MAYYNTALLYVLVLMWPLVFGTMSAIYASEFRVYSKAVLLR